MANTKSAVKRHRQSTERRARNRGERSRLRTAVKDLRSAVERGEAKEAQELLAATLKVVDTSASKGVIHRNTADRTKSRLSRAVAGIQK